MLVTIRQGPQHDGFDDLISKLSQWLAIPRPELESESSGLPDTSAVMQAANAAYCESE